MLPSRHYTNHIKMNFQKGFVVPLILVILALVVAGGVGYVSYEQGKSGQVHQENQQFLEQYELNRRRAAT